MALATSWIVAAMLVSAAASATASYSAQNSASKAAKTANDIQQGSARAASDMLVAKEKAASDILAEAAATSETQAKGQVTAKKRAIARSETIFTSPLGIGGMADVSRKMLLGQ